MADSFHLLRQAHAKLLRACSAVAWLPGLLMRVTLGEVFILSGWGKLHNLDQVITFFGELGIPAPQLQAPFVACLEFVGGILLLLGLGTRLFALPLIGTMVVAVITARHEELRNVDDLFGFIEYLYGVMLLALAVHGPGTASLDKLIASKYAIRDGAGG